MSDHSWRQSKAQQLGSQLHYTVKSRRTHPVRDKTAQIYQCTPFICAFPMSQTCHNFQPVSHQVEGYRRLIHVTTPSALTPADLPLEEHDLCPGGKHDPSFSSRQHKLNLQTHHINYLPVNGSDGKRILSSPSRAERQAVFNCDLGKTKAKMLAAVMCVARNAPVLSLTELCKNDSVETFAWYSVRPRPPYAQAEHTLSGMLTHTHRARQILPWGFSNYPQWMGGSLTHRGPTARVITHPTKTPHISSDYPIFNFHLCFFFLWEGMRCMGGRVRRRS